MFNQKHKENKIINSNLPLFTLFCLCGVLYIGFIVNYWYLLLILLLPLTVRHIKINIWQILLLSIVLVIFILLITFTNQFSVISLLNKWIKSIGGNHLRNAIIMFFDKHYSPETSSFIKLILLNIKSEETYIFYKQVVDLGIVWLICISGFHITLISRLINLMFRKIPKVGKYVNISIISVYSYILNFTYPSLRILLKFSLDWIFKRYSIKRYEKLGFVGLIICLLNPVCFKNIGFLLTFMACIVAYFVNGFQLNNKIITSLLINTMTFIISIPFVIGMNHKISLFTFINAFVFTYFSSILFIYFLTFSWMPFLAVIHRGMIIAAYVLIGNISFFNIYVYSSDWSAWQNSLFYLISFGVAKGVYLIVYNNKI